MVQKDGDFVFWSMPEQMFIFLGSKNCLYPPLTLFWDTLYSSFSKNRTFQISLSMDLDSHGFTDCKNMCLYAGRIRILRSMLGGAVPWVVFIPILD